MDFVFSAESLLAPSMDPDEEGVVAMVIPGAAGHAPTLQSEAVTNELQELSLHPAPKLLPLRDRKNVLQLKLQHRRTREELVGQGIMPPLKSPAAFHEQRKSLERARTEDYLKRKIRSRPERSELVRMHILEETSAEPSLQAKQLKLKRARLADDLNEKIAQRPGPIELIEKNILPVDSNLKEAIIVDVVLLSSDGQGGSFAAESSSFDEDSSDALSPEQPASQESQGSQSSQNSQSSHCSAPSPPESKFRDLHQPAQCSPPTQFVSQAPPPADFLKAPPPAEPAPPLKLTNGMTALPVSKPAPTLIKQSQPKSLSDKSSQRKKSKDSKPKVKKLKYHQYIPPDQKQERELPPAMDSSYAKVLHQQQLFLQLQILNQQQQHYNYQTILPAPPKPPGEQQGAGGGSGSSAQPRSLSSSSPGGGPGALTRQNSNAGGSKPDSLPPNLDELKVAELKHELKLRSLPVSGTKIDLVERLRVYQDHRNSQAQVAPGNGSHSNGSHINCPTTVLHRPGEGGVVLATFPLVATVPGPGGGPSAMATPTVMQFGSTSSTPPGSPAPSERSTMGGSADEASCNGDAFGEAMSSPPMHLIKEEHCSTAAPCRFSQHALQQPQQPITGGRTFDKDQMLQEKDKQIEELTRMLRQKQKLVETLRSQLEQGKSPPSPSNLDPSIQRVLIKQEPGEPSSQGQQGPLWPPEEFSEVTVKEEPESEMAEEVPVQQVSPAPHVFLNQPPPSLAPPSFPLDILKTPLPPTLLTDSNGNHFLLALTNHSTDAQRSDTAKQAGRITLQRLQSSPTKLPSQSPPQLLTTSAQSKQQQQPDLINQPIRKGQKPGLHLMTSVPPGTVFSFSAPPSLQPFFLGNKRPAPCPSPNQRPGPASTPPNHKAPPQSQSPSKVCPIPDQHALFSPSPSPPGGRSKEPPQYQEALKQNPDRESAPCSQQMDDLFDILIENGEISADFKGDTDPPPAPLTRLRPNTPPLPPCPDPALTLTLSHSPPLPLAQDPGDSSTGSAVALAGSGRLEDFLESTTGAPLLRADAEGCGQRLSLIDDLHNEMLSTASILDQPLPSPMDTSELHFPVAPGDPAAGPPPSSGHLGSLGLDLADPCLDSMDWLDLTMGMGLGLNSGLPSFNTQTPSSVFSTDFLDSHDLQLHWDSCL
ncbi:myocardin-related transcription factor A-like isoform X2 [Acipenser ruthenus]|uniref:myocardin-related transcription factor A-like isoform X2 n=1 Tax=Acipenser ruthenus TaxID=7906 RepID=UPI002740C190|nr:myocardin-related transcription factor A-like isoform X2 [Acipenser ruthenus]